MQGRIIKGIAGFYYVAVESELYECKAKGIFRKEKMKPLVGDLVEIEILDEEKKLGNIVDILPRKNSLIRPAVANIDQALVIFAAKEPNPNLSLLDRFLVTMERQEIPVLICINKEDLALPEEIEEIKTIYQNCGYPVIFTSASKEKGIEELRAVLNGKTTAVAGPSGVGKSSLTNLLAPVSTWKREKSVKSLGEGVILQDILNLLNYGRKRILWTHRDLLLSMWRIWKSRSFAIIFLNFRIMRGTADFRDVPILMSRVVW